jgi:chorismate mutase
MSISREMKILYQNLSSDVVSESPSEKKVIAAILTNDTVKTNLEFRLKVAQVVGQIKFFNNLPIFVPAVEEKIIDGIKKDSINKNINPILTTSFVKVVMEHSKAVQAQLCELLKGKEIEANQMLLEAVSSLKPDLPGKADILTSLGDRKVPASQNLQHCRGLIQAATDNVLNEMASISEKMKVKRRLAVVTGGFFNSMAVTDRITTSPDVSPMHCTQKTFIR